MHFLPAGQSASAAQEQAEAEPHLCPVVRAAQSASVAQTQIVPLHLLPSELTPQFASVLHSTHPEVGSQVFSNSSAAQFALVLHWTHVPSVVEQYLLVVLLAQWASVLQATQVPRATMQYLSVVLLAQSPSVLQGLKQCL